MTPYRTCLIVNEQTDKDLVLLYSKSEKENPTTSDVIEEAITITAKLYRFREQGGCNLGWFFDHIEEY